MTGSSDASAPALEALPPALLDPRTRRGVSCAAAGLAFAAMAALGGLQLWKDGSFWIDEASVAESLQHLGPWQLLGPLMGGQSYPRLQLLAVRGLVALFGYHTGVARALPFVSFLAGSLAWMRLLWLRFRDEPALVALGGLLLLVPAPWFVYGAMLKPYTFDVLAATVPFLLADRFYDEVLAEGRRPLRGVALAALGALSYPFVLALLARVGGWWLWRAAAGPRRVSRLGALSCGLATGVFGVGLWYTDLRHTAAMGPALHAFWQACTVGSGGSLTELLGRFAFGWWDGRCEFSPRGGLPPTLQVGLHLALAAGGLRVAWGAWRRLRRVPPARGDDPVNAVWGGRSLGCGLLAAGLPFVSLVVGYPICAGRLTLFALLPLLVLVLEGLDGAGHALRRLPRGPELAAVAGIAAALGVLPTSLGNAQRLAVAKAPGNLRGLLARTRERPGLPILTTSCTRKQLETLPEGAPARLLYVERGGPLVAAVQEPHEAWLLYVPASYCEAEVQRLLKTAETWKPADPSDASHPSEYDGHLLWLRFRPPGKAPRRATSDADRGQVSKRAARSVRSAASTVSGTSRDRVTCGGPGQSASTKRTPW